MTKLTEGGIYEMWPGNGSVEIQSLSFALQQMTGKLLGYLSATNCYCDIDSLSEEILDYLAVELRAMYYDQSLTVEQKRKVIKNTLKWYMKAGTTSAVNEMMQVIFGEGETLEWFDNQGYESEATDPYEFDVITSVGYVSMTPEAIQTVTDVINRVKNVRSHLGSIYFSRTLNEGQILGWAATLPQSFPVVTIFNHFGDIESEMVVAGRPTALVEEFSTGINILNNIGELELTVQTGADPVALPQTYPEIMIANSIGQVDRDIKTAPGSAALAEATTYVSIS